MYKRRPNSVSRLIRFYLYSIHGYVLEVTFTAICSFLTTFEWKLAGSSSIWALGIYGTGGLMLEECSNILRQNSVAWWLRGLFYVCMIYFWEFSWGLFLASVSACPWDYSDFRYNVRGLITLEYAPFWFVTGLVAERMLVVLLEQLQWLITENPSIHFNPEGSHRTKMDSYILSSEAQDQLEFVTPTASREVGDGVSSNKPDKNWAMRKLCGGYRIPYPSKKYAKEQSLCQTPTREVARLPLRPKPIFTPNIPAVECAICFSPVKEATVPKCGHMFCHQCISEWSHVRSWCPLCQDPVKPLIRIYSVDEQIEKYYLENFSSEERLEYEEARARREDEQKVRAKKEKQFFARMSRKVTNLQLYFQSKGFFHGIGIKIHRGWRGMGRMRFCSAHLVLGVLLGFLLGYLVFSYFASFSLFHFFRYMWDAVKNYTACWTPEPPADTGCDKDDMYCQKLTITPVPSCTGKRKLPAHNSKYNLFTELRINLLSWFGG